MKKIGKNFEPDYNNIINAVQNKKTARLPLYEHGISFDKFDKLLGCDLGALYGGDKRDNNEFMRLFFEGYRQFGYDYASIDQNITGYLVNGGALLHEQKGTIKTMEDFQKYPFDEFPKLFADKTKWYFDLIKSNTPAGMKAAGGPGNGIFETVQDLTGFTNLCYIKADDPELYAALFRKVGEMNYKVWEWFLKNYADDYCVCRFGDDLGYKSMTLLSTDDIKEYIIPEYKQIIKLIHSYKKPFIFHSCGCIFDVMDDIISEAKIDAKHSNEDVIAPFPVWVEKYGSKIGNLGGIDVDVLCRANKAEMREYIEPLVRCKDYGFGLGSGNSIAPYVTYEQYMTMLEIIEQLRN